MSDDLKPFAAWISLVADIPPRFDAWEWWPDRVYLVLRVPARRVFRVAALRRAA